MLRVQSFVLQFIEQLQPVLATIHRYDRSLEDQLRRASTSVSLDLSEGVDSYGGNKRVRYATALGSFRETVMAVRVAKAFGYIKQVPHELETQADTIARMLVGLARR